MKYQAPKMEFVSFCAEDILTTTIGAGDNSLKFDIFETLNVFDD